MSEYRFVTNVCIVLQKYVILKTIKKKQNNVCIEAYQLLNVVPAFF